MTLTVLLAVLDICAADSARALVTLRHVPQAAVVYAQMAAVENGEWMVHYGRLLEASGDFVRARTAYGLALGNATSEDAARWLQNRRRGTVLLDTCLVIRVEIVNTGEIAARDVQVLLPEPEEHPPSQELLVLSSDFQGSMGVLTAHIPCLAPGDTVVLALGLRIMQRPFSMRPIPAEITDETLNWLSRTMRELPVPGALPGPCVPMCQEMKRLASGIGLPLEITGGLMIDGEECVFHAWNEITGTGIRLDPLQFKTDSLLAVAHSPSDVIPLWNLDATDGYELTLLYDDHRYRLSGEMTAFFK